MLESPSCSTTCECASIPAPSLGNPYRDLAALAERLADGLEHRAQSCESSSERRRLLLLAAASTQIHSCLSNTGVKSGLNNKTTGKTGTI